MARTTIKVNADTKQAKKEFKSMSDSIDGIAKVSKKVALASGAMFAGMTAAMVGATKVFGEFQNDMLSVKTLLDEGSFVNAGKTLDQGFKEMSKNTLKVFSKMPISLKAATKSMFNLVSAGVKASKATEVLAKAAKLATAGVTTVDVAVDGLTSVMNAYKISAEEADTVSGKFFLAQKFGKTTIEELASGFGKVGSSASALNVSFEEVLSSVSAMTLSGIATSEAYTGLKAVLTGIAKPTAEAAEEAARLGVKFDAAALRSKGLKGFLDDLTKSSGFTKDSVTKLFGSVEAINTIFALTGDNAGKFGDILTNVNDDVLAAKTVNEAYETQVKSFNNQMTILGNKSKALIVQIGKRLEPMFQKLVTVFGKVADKFAEMDDGTKDLIVSFGIFVTGAAGITAALSTFAMVLPNIVQGFALMKKAMLGLSVIMRANPIGIALTALSLAVTVLGVDWEKAFAKMAESVTDLQKHMKNSGMEIKTIWNRLDSWFDRITISGNKRRNELSKAAFLKGAKDMVVAKQAEHEKAVKLAAKQGKEEAEARATATVKAEKKAWEEREINRKKFQADVAEGDKLTQEAADRRQDIETNAALVGEKERLEQTRIMKEAEARSFTEWSGAVFSQGMEGVIGKALGSITDMFLPGFGGAVSQMFNFLAQDSDAFVNQINAMFSGKFLDNIATNITTLAEKLPELIPPFIQKFVEALPKISAALIKLFNDPTVTVQLVTGIISAFYKGMYNAYMGVFKSIENAMHFEAPEWVKQFAEAVRRLTNFSFGGSKSSGTKSGFSFDNSALVTGASAMFGGGVTTPAAVDKIGEKTGWWSQGKAPSKAPVPMYLAEGFKPRGPDTMPAMIDPRERILSNADNVAVVSALNDIRSSLAGGQTIKLEFLGDGAQELVERMLVKATALGTGRIDIAVGSEA